MQFFTQGPPEALEMDLTYEGIFARNQILRTFALIQLFDPRLPSGSRPWIKSAIGAFGSKSLST